VFVGTLPLLLLALQRALDLRRSWWWAPVTGLALLLVLLHNGYQFVFAALAIGFFVLAALLAAQKDQRRPLLLRTMLIGICVLVIVGPLLLAISRAASNPVSALVRPGRAGTSTSIRTRFQFEQQSAIEFLLQILKARSDRAFVMGFDVTPDVKADWTNNIDALETGINRLRPGGGTAMYDAVYTACKTKLLDSSRGQEPVRKAMILISDGDDNQSRVHLDESIKMCQRAETIVYAISTNWTPSRGKGDQVLTQLAQDTGGQVFFPPSVEQMSNSFKNIEEELRSQYALTYIPADFKASGQFRPIYLYCTDRRYTARARKGYFAPKD